MENGRREDVLPSTSGSGLEPETMARPVQQQLTPMDHWGSDWDELLPCSATHPRFSGGTLGQAQVATTLYLGISAQILPFTGVASQGQPTSYRFLYK